MQVIQLSPGCLWQCIRKLGPLHNAPGTVWQSTAPGADTALGSGLALPYAAQYDVSTLFAKRHDVPEVPRPARVPNPVAVGNEKPSSQDSCRALRSGPVTTRGSAAA